MSETLHLGDCMQACNKCTDNYHAQFINAPCDMCYTIIEASEYTITAKLLNTYEIKVMASSAVAAIASLDEWISDDFEPHLTNAQWDLEVH